jgi:hypothetical protein
VQDRTTKPPRHPLCPGCGYDLSATVDAGHRICPECGCAFELHELDHERRPGDWTPARGLRNIAAWLLLKTVVAGALWCGVLWVSARVPLLTLGCYGAALSAGIGAGLGAIIGARLGDQAGFAGPLVTGLAVISAAIAILGGAVVMNLVLGPASGYVWLAGYAVALVGAAASIAWFTIADA